MIISHKSKYIYFAVPKTATHSVREALHQHSKDGDWEQQALYVDESIGKQTIPISEIALIGHGHISVTQIKHHIPADQWQESFKFAFVRNPFDRFVSVCFFLNRNNPEFTNNSLAWMKSAISHPRFQQRVLVRPQFMQLTDEKSHLAMDYIGRYEALRESMNFVNDALKFPRTTLKVKNKSDHADYRSYYDDELFSLVSDYYKADIKHFDYKF
ncbi:MAG: hypothetical protein ACI9LY_002537 [Arenicella sp.]